MRLSLIAVPALLATLVLATGCHSASRVKYAPDGSAVAAEEIPFTPVANQTVVEPVAKPDPTVVAPEQVAQPQEPVAQPKEPKNGGKNGTKGGTKPTHGVPGGHWTVKKGDTLQKISKTVYGTTKKWHSIMKANNMSDDKIHVGQKLVLPAK